MLTHIYELLLVRCLIMLQQNYIKLWPREVNKRGFLSTLSGRHQILKKLYLLMLMRTSMKVPYCKGPPDFSGAPNRPCTWVVCRKLWPGHCQIRLYSYLITVDLSGAVVRDVMLSWPVNLNWEKEIRVRCTLQLLHRQAIHTITTITIKTTTTFPTKVLLLFLKEFKIAFAVGTSWLN